MINTIKKYRNKFIQAKNKRDQAIKEQVIANNVRNSNAKRLEDLNNVIGE